MAYNNFQKGSINIPTVASIAIIAVISSALLIYVGIKFYEMPSTLPPITIITPRPTLNETPAPTPVVGGETADWKTYRNDEIGFEFKYPSFMYENEIPPGAAGLELGYEPNDVVISYGKKFEDASPDGYIKVRILNKIFDPDKIETLDGYEYSLEDVNNGTTGTWKLWKENIQDKDVYLSEFGGDGVSGLEAVMPSGDKIVLMEFANKISEGNYPKQTLSTFRLIEKIEKIKFGSDEPSAKLYCQSLISQDYKVGTFSYFANNSGEKFVDCGIYGAGSESLETVHLIGKYIDSQWVEIWAGDGKIPQDIIVKYGISKEATD